MMMNMMNMIDPPLALLHIADVAEEEVVQEAEDEQEEEAEAVEEEEDAVHHLDLEEEAEDVVVAAEVYANEVHQSMMMSMMKSHH